MNERRGVRSRFSAPTTGSCSSQKRTLLVISSFPLVHVVLPDPLHLPSFLPPPRATSSRCLQRCTDSLVFLASCRRTGTVSTTEFNLSSAPSRPRQSLPHRTTRSQTAPMRTTSRRCTDFGGRIPSLSTRRGMSTSRVWTRAYLASRHSSPLPAWFPRRPMALPLCTPGVVLSLMTI